MKRIPRAKQPKTTAIKDNFVDKEWCSAAKHILMAGWGGGEEGISRGRGG